MVLKNNGASDMPVGIFDSGMGGLTVLKALIERLPSENTVYLGDTARLPYGTKSAETVVRYSLQNTAFLVRQNIKLLVVACNTASANSLPVLAEKYDVPVIGVIEPGARAAVRETRNSRIGVIGTHATIDSRAYEVAIGDIDPGISLIQVPCPLFVSLAEEGWTDNEVARMAAEKYLAPMAGCGIDTLLLGCTHYPLLKGVISEVIGDGVRLIDSALETAAAVSACLEEKGMKRAAKEKGWRKFFVTDLPSRFWEVSRRFLGEELDNVSLVDLNGDGIRNIQKGTDDEN